MSQGSGAGASGGASGGGGGYSGGYGGGGGGGGSIYGLGDNPQGSGIGTRGQGGRTQNKTFAEILALAPPPQFMGLRPSQGVRPGDLTGSGGTPAPTVQFLPVKDATGDYPTLFTQPGVQKLGQQAGKEGRSAIAAMYEKLFAEERGGPVSPTGEVGRDQSYADILRSSPPPTEFDTQVNYLGGGGGGGAPPMLPNQWGYM